MVFRIICALLVLPGLSLAQGTKPKSKPPASSQRAPASQAFVLSEKDADLGRQLVAQSDCGTCHQQQGTLVGPGHKEVAQKYSLSKASADYLAGKIRNGGSGVWGDAAMPAHPDLSPEQAGKIALYILSLK